MFCFPTKLGNHVPGGDITGIIDHTTRLSLQIPHASEFRLINKNKLEAFDLLGFKNKSWKKCALGCPHFVCIKPCMLITAVHRLIGPVHINSLGSLPCCYLCHSWRKDRCPCRFLREMKGNYSQVASGDIRTSDVVEVSSKQLPLNLFLSQACLK